MLETIAKGRGMAASPQITREKIQEQIQLVSAIYMESIPSLRHRHTVQLKVMLSFSVIFTLFFYLRIHDIVQFDDTRYFFPLMTLSEGRDRALAEHLALSPAPSTECLANSTQELFIRRGVYTF